MNQEVKLYVAGAAFPPGVAPALRHRALIRVGEVVVWESDPMELTEAGARGVHRLRRRRSRHRQP